MVTKENGKVLTVLIILVLIVVIVVFAGYKYYINSLELNDFGTTQIEIKSGMGVEAISDMLEKEGIIQNSLTFKIYCKLNNKTMMQAGKYTITSDMSLDDMLAILAKGEIVSEEITITFPEGKNMKQIASIIAENTNNTEKQVYDLLDDDNYINGLINDYWFITGDVTNPNIYYPLEGYLYPDTYNFASKNESVENIFKKMLDKMATVLEPYRDDILNNDYSIHELLSLASIVELESPTDEDRAMIAGVFYERIKVNMPLQSDVTTYYGLQIPMSERDLTASDLAQNNGYNTGASQMKGKLPIGPICSVGESSIKAVLNPVDSEYLYFAADKNGKIYFSESYEEHLETVQDLKDKGLWFTYN